MKLCKEKLINRRIRENWPNKSKKGLKMQPNRNVKHQKKVFIRENKKI